MASHLAHKLPWASLYEIVLRRPSYDALRSPYKLPLTDDEKKKIAHFARCLVAAIAEFRDSDRSSEDERAFYDPYEWDGQHPFGGGGCIGFYDSIGEGYVKLNLLLMDPDKMEPRLIYKNRTNYSIRALVGHCDGSHPDELADHLKQAIDEDTYHLKRPLTANTVKVLRDHAAMLFRCMYSTSGENEGWRDPQRLANIVEWAVLNP